MVATLTGQRRVTAVVLAVGLLALSAVAWLGLSLSSWPDWTIEAQPSVDALLSGHLDAFLRLAPAYGPSLLLRAPFMELAHLAGGGGRAVYAAGALPFLAALAGLSVWLSRGLADRGGHLTAQALTVVLCVGNPLVVPALQLGHPEDLLGGALCVAAVACAQRDRAVWSGVLVGLATANKPWGLLAAGPVLVALSHARGRSIAAMASTAGVLMAPFMLARSGGVTGQAAGVGVGASTIFNPWQLWWFLGAPAAHAGGAQRIAPAWLGGMGHVLIIALMPPITLAFARRHRCAARQRGPEVYLLLALLMALRCALDPWDISYYALPALLALLAWETSSHARPPLITLMGTFAAWLVLQETSSLLGDNQNALAALYTLVAVPAITVIAGRLFAPPRAMAALRVAPA